MKGYTYPRSLSEAFNDAGRACAVHGPYKTQPVVDAVVGWICTVLLVCVVLALARGWL